MRILITGDSGFVGQHALAAWPNASGLMAWGMARNGQEVSILDKATLCAALEDCKPDAVLHLAAQSFVPESFANPAHTLEVNLMGTLRLLEALKATGFQGRMLQVGTADTYGLVPTTEMPIQESRLLQPRNPYAVSKAAAEALCYQWSQTEKFEVLMARPFNHIGEGQAAHFAVSSFAKQLAEMSLGLRAPVLSVGNLEASRDFTDVHDVLRAYALLLEKGHSGEVYNICSGQAHSLQSVVDRLLKLSGVDVQIEIDRDKLRPAEQTQVWGSYEKINKHTGWRPEISMDMSLHNVYHYWKRELRV
jgi:GDP-4-dehydro-6-deoxy-D-mannose reductase